MISTLISKLIHTAINITSFLALFFLVTTGYTASKPTEAKEVVVQVSTETPTTTPTPKIITPTATPTQSSILYTVQVGDSLASIANRYGLTWIELANLNQLADPSNLSIGQVIKISFNPQDYKDIDPYYVNNITKVEGNTKHILVVLSEQSLSTYEGDKLINKYLISSGTSDHPTVVGEFKVWIKLESTTMTGEGYNLPGVKWTMYFYKDYGIHGTYWHNNFGTPMSHGCINMSDSDAKEVFDWAEVGTIVQVIQ